jgi:hypothetical protein
MQHLITFAFPLNANLLYTQPPLAPSSMHRRSTAARQLRRGRRFSAREFAEDLRVISATGIFPLSYIVTLFTAC